MKKRPNVCDTRICIRLPWKLVETINKECDKTNTNLSVFTREALVELLSQRAIEFIYEPSLKPSLRVSR